MFPVFIDIEASSLSKESYPIEVAWNNPDGEILSYLINPYSIEEWQDWSEESEKAHGIQREDLYSIGVEPEIIVEKLNKCLCDQDVYSDAINHDTKWLDRLFSCTKMSRMFNIRDFSMLIPNEIRGGGFPGGGIIYDYQELARQRAGVPAHRAGNDVKYLIELYKIIKQHY